MKIPVLSDDRWWSNNKKKKTMPTVGSNLLILVNEPTPKRIAKRQYRESSIGAVVCFRTSFLFVLFPYLQNGYSRTIQKVSIKLCTTDFVSCPSIVAKRAEEDGMMCLNSCCGESVDAERFDPVRRPCASITTCRKSFQVALGECGGAPTNFAYN